MLSREAILEAKREVLVAQGRGMLYSPEEAWAVAGHHRQVETLWSIASRVGLRLGESPEGLCEYLEKAFPYCSFQRSRLDTNIWQREEGYL
jgi:hypothetical protein